jgi:hypothetical protein
VFVPAIINQSAGQKSVKLTITPAAGYGNAKELFGSVTLVANHAPTIIRFDILSPDIIEPGVAVTIQGVATDEDNDILSYTWNMFGNSDPVQLGLITNPVVVHPLTNIIHGSLLVTDPYGGSDMLAIPPVLVSSRVVVDGIVGMDLTYIPRAMSATPTTFTFGSIPVGLSFVDGTVMGIPQVVGITNTFLEAVSSSGTDHRLFTWRISAAVIPPLSPTNLIVNGDGNNPRYRTGQSLVIQWVITNDGGVIPTSVIELRRFDGDLVKTYNTGQGVNILTVTSADIVSLFGDYQDIVIRVYALRNNVRSVFPAQTIVVYAF